MDIFHHKLADLLKLVLMNFITCYIQENMSLMADGYQGDVLGESTPDVIVNEFVWSCSTSFNLCIIAWSFFTLNILFPTKFLRLNYYRSSGCLSLTLNHRIGWCTRTMALCAMLVVYVVQKIVDINIAICDFCLLIFQSFLLLLSI